MPIRRFEVHPHSIVCLNLFLFGLVCYRVFNDLPLSVHRRVRQLPRFELRLYVMVLKRKVCIYNMYIICIYLRMYSVFLCKYNVYIYLCLYIQKKIYIYLDVY